MVITGGEPLGAPLQGLVEDRSQPHPARSSHDQLGAFVAADGRRQEADPRRHADSSAAPIVAMVVSLLPGSPLLVDKGAADVSSTDGSTISVGGRARALTFGYFRMTLVKSAGVRVVPTCT